MKCKSPKIFVLMNSFNIPMQKVLKKEGFSYAGEIIGLDEEDP
jgi:hypothetical protein